MDSVSPYLLEYSTLIRYTIALIYCCILLTDLCTYLRIEIWRLIKIQRSSAVMKNNTIHIPNNTTYTFTYVCNSNTLLIYSYIKALHYSIT